ncbi:MAG: hypothetical protein JJU31_06865 [Wenzhouxiangella sp.]|nr:hypothetical protein [Wenzhouxiangella sp.]
MLLNVHCLLRCRLMFVFTGVLLLAACGGNDGSAPATPVAELRPAESQAADHATDHPGAEAAQVSTEPETRQIGVTAHLQGFEVEVRAATFKPRLMFDEVLATIVEVDTVMTNLVDENRRGPGYGFLEVNGERISSGLQPPFISALGSEEVVLRFELEPGVGPDDSVLWFVQRSGGHPVAIPLGDVGPVYTLAPIEFEFATPEPFGSLVFEGSQGWVRFYGDGHRQLAGHAYVDIDLVATNTGDSPARISRYKVEVGGFDSVTGNVPLRAGNLRLGPGESTDRAIRRFQFPIYGERIRIFAEAEINTEPFLFLEFEVPGLLAAIPESLHPTPPD